MNNQITTQSPWESPLWWLMIVSQAIVLALTNCIDQGLGNVSVMTVVVNTLIGIQMFLSVNNSGIKGAMMLPPGQEVVTTDAVTIPPAIEYTDEAE